MSETLVIEFEVQPAKVDWFLETLRQTMPETRRFEGNEGIELYRDAERPNRMMFFEQWRSREDYQRYGQWRTETGVSQALKDAMLGQPSARWFTHEPTP